MEIQTEINIQRLTPCDLKLIDIQRKINEIRDNNSYSEIVITFKDGILAYWCEKTTHQ